jgi:N-acetyl-anhydromuramyl-L-alanine amidase AmpD
MQKYWKNNLKWSNPGYHYLIAYDGLINVLAEHDKICNGVAGHNKTSLHVSYIGGVENGKAKDTRSAEQLEAMISLLRDLKALYPKAKICGHRDFSPDQNKNGKIDGWEYIKQCPSFDVATWLKTIQL